jgi:hypothetical protein
MTTSRLGLGVLIAMVAVVVLDRGLGMLRPAELLEVVEHAGEGSIMDAGALAL